MIRRCSTLILGFLLLAGSAPCSEILYFCRETKQSGPECCCQTANGACTDSAPSACECCETRLTHFSPGDDAYPLSSRTQIDPPTRVDAGFLGTPAFPDPGRANAQGFQPRYAAEPGASPPPLYLTLCVLLC